MESAHRTSAHPNPAPQHNKLHPFSLRVVDKLDAQPIHIRLRHYQPVFSVSILTPQEAFNTDHIFSSVSSAFASSHLLCSWRFRLHKPTKFCGLEVLMFFTLYPAATNARRRIISISTLIARPRILLCSFVVAGSVFRFSNDKIGKLAHKRTTLSFLLGLSFEHFRL